MEKCRISFKSFKFIHIKNSIQQICAACSLWKIPIHSLKYSAFPAFTRRFTVLRSPHVHKKSREQFEWVRKKGEITLEFKEQKHLLLLIFFLQNSQFPGVELKITVQTSTKLPVPGGKETA